MTAHSEVDEASAGQILPDAVVSWINWGTNPRDPFAHNYPLPAHNRNCGGKKTATGETAMIQAIPPSTPERVEADFYPSLKNPAVALCTEVWQKIHAATL